MIVADPQAGRTHPQEAARSLCGVERSAWASPEEEATSTVQVTVRGGVHPGMVLSRGNLRVPAARAGRRPPPSHAIRSSTPSGYQAQASAPPKIDQIIKTNSRSSFRSSYRAAWPRGEAANDNKSPALRDAPELA